MRTEVSDVRQCGTPRASMILPRAPRVPVPTGTHGEPRTPTVRLSLTVRQNASLLTDGYAPLLCKAVLRRHRAQPRVPGKAKLICQAVRLVPMLFGMNASGSRFSNSCRQPAGAVQCTDGTNVGHQRGKSVDRRPDDRLEQPTGQWNPPSATHIRSTPVGTRGSARC